MLSPADVGEHFLELGFGDVLVGGMVRVLLDGEELDEDGAVEDALGGVLGVVAVDSPHGGDRVCSESTVGSGSGRCSSVFDRGCLKRAIGEEALLSVNDEDVVADSSFGPDLDYHTVVGHVVAQLAEEDVGYTKVEYHLGVEVGDVAYVEANTFVRDSDWSWLGEVDGAVGGVSDELDCICSHVSIAHPRNELRFSVEHIGIC